MADKWRDSDLETDVSPGQWVRDGLGVFARVSVGSIVPTGFESYARILQPLESVDEHGKERWLRWSDVARAVGAVTHPEMELGAILKRAPRGFLWSNPPTPESQVPPWPDQMIVLTDILSNYTQSRDDCYFAFWEGNTAFEGVPSNIPRLPIGSFRYFLFHGPITRAVDTFRGLTTNIFWPADRAWCVVSHFDFPSTYLGGTTECVEEVLRAEVIEAWPATVDQVITADNDRLNS